MDEEKENRKVKLIRSDKVFNQQIAKLSKEYNMSESAAIRLAVKNEHEKFTTTKGEK